LQKGFTFATPTGKALYAVVLKKKKFKILFGNLKTFFLPLHPATADVKREMTRK